ncbi:hypothetical protein L7F22_053090 [Adiantum nelumboides]|nr:hypothetical protein [Adiantum nelumboides]
MLVPCRPLVMMQAKTPLTNTKSPKTRITDTRPLLKARVNIPLFVLCYTRILLLIKGLRPVVDPMNGTGTGAGYGELKEYVEEATEKHAVGEHTEGKHEVGSGSFGSDSGGLAAEGKHHHDKEGKHHTGPMAKIKHKMKEGLAKVRKKKDHHSAGGEALSPHGSTSSEDEAGLHAAEKGLHR